MKSLGEQEWPDVPIVRQADTIKKKQMTRIRFSDVERRK